MLQTIHDLGHESESLCREFETGSDQRDHLRWIAVYASIMHAIELAASLIDDNLSIHRNATATEKRALLTATRTPVQMSRGSLAKNPGDCWSWLRLQADEFSS